jgi:hypothetical protein
LPQLQYKDLFDNVLLGPAGNSDELCIVSGFATSAMAKKHIDKVAEIFDKTLSLSLIVGMVPITGIGESHHNIFKGLSQNKNISFTCYYIRDQYAPVHSKVYVWLRKGNPVLSFTGSANYTQNAFFTSQEEILCQCNPSGALKYYKNLENKSVDCSHIDADQYCRKDIITSEGDYYRDEKNTELETYNLSLYSVKTGKMQESSGLNWGLSKSPKSPGNPRKRNDAYIPIPSSIYKTNFFPKKGQYFSVRTDDSFSMTLSRAQQNGKAIHSPNDNTEIGIYFRKRLGVPLGKKIRMEDLDNYGRRDVTFVKLDEEDYYMDFSV